MLLISHNRFLHKFSNRIVKPRFLSTAESVPLSQSIKLVQLKFSNIYTFWGSDLMQRLLFLNTRS